MNTFSIKRVFSHAWTTFKQHKGLVVLAGLISLVVGGGAKSDTGIHKGHVDFHSPSIFSILFFVLNILIQIGLVKMFLKLLDGHSARLKELVSHGDLFIKYLCVYILFMLGFVGGTILLVIPGIWFFLTYFFAPIIMIDKHVGIRDSFRQSAHMTKGAKWKLLGLMLLIVLLNILGAVALIVGLLVTIPLTSLIFLEVYRVLGGRHEAPRMA
jgi:uncharacterized membrane protein